MNINDFDNKVPGCIRVRQPKCPFVAVIPTLTVDTISGVKGLADCFVHIVNINTTIYIDDQHRYIMTYAGPVFVDDYDYEANPLNLRGQSCYDFKNNREIIYNNVGKYRIKTLTEVA